MTLDLHYRPFRMERPDVTVVQREEAWYISRVQSLSAFPSLLTDRLAEGAKAHPDRWLIARRRPSGEWEGLTYAQMMANAMSIGQALNDRKLSAERPLAILSGNGFEHLQMALGAMMAGVPYAPISPAYSLLSTDYSRLRHAVEILQPGAVFAADGAAFSAAIGSVLLNDVEVITSSSGQLASTPLPELLATKATTIEAVNRALGPETIAKFLLTSGSTGLPKIVPTTHRMLCSNQQMLRDAFPELAREPPVLVDWLPWSHTFGGSHDVGMALYNGGTLYIDEGKATVEGLPQTVRNLRDIAPTIYLSVPRGWELLTSALERDVELRNTFFSRVKMLFFAGAGLSPDVWGRLQRVAEMHCGERIHIVGGLGMTETAPASLLTAGLRARPGDVGLPAPGCVLKLVPCADKLEARYRGPHVMTGYWRSGATQTDTGFDEEGFFCSGDALRFVDPEQPALGLAFDGRLGEDFKLSSGTFVRTGPLRERIVALGAPYVLDVVLTGINRDEIGALIFPRFDACCSMAALPVTASCSEIVKAPAVWAFFQRLLVQMNRESKGSATTISRMRLLDEPASSIAGEITDKGSISQHAVLTRRAGLIDALYEPRGIDRSTLYAADDEPSSL